MRKIDVRIVDPDGDATFAADCADDLQSWLEQLQPAADVTREQSPDEPGTKGAGLEWAQLAVAFTGAVAPLVVAIRGWRTNNDRALVRVSIDGDEICLDSASQNEQDRLVANWVERHPN
jgi:hypothetical protein